MLSNLLLWPEELGIEIFVAAGDFITPVYSSVRAMYPLYIHSFGSIHGLYYRAVTAIVNPIPRIYNQKDERTASRDAPALCTEMLMSS